MTLRPKALGKAKRMCKWPNLSVTCYGNNPFISEKINPCQQDTIYFYLARKKVLIAGFDINTVKVKKSPEGLAQGLKQQRRVATACRCHSTTQSP
jgi:hypothetical protein